MHLQDKEVRLYEVDYRAVWKQYYLCHCRKWNGSYTDWILKGNQQLGGADERNF